MSPDLVDFRPGVFETLSTPGDWDGYLIGGVNGLDWLAHTWTTGVTVAGGCLVIALVPLLDGSGGL